MTVKELITELNKYPENMEVFLANRKTEFTYGLLNSVKTDNITFMEDESELYDTEERQTWEEIEEKPKVACVILDEE